MHWLNILFGPIGELIYYFRTTVLSLESQIPGFVLGLIGGIISEPIRQWIFRPRLSLEFRENQDFITKTIEGLITAPEAIACYVRVRVTNRKWRIAKNCRAYLVNVEVMNSSGRFEPTEYCDSIQLAWSARGDEAYFAIDLPKGIPQFLDVISVREISPDIRPEIRVQLNRYRALWRRKGSFRFSVQVSGDGLKPVQLSLRCDWNGRLDDLRASLA